VGRGTVNSVSQVTATMNGVIVERHLALGQVVQPSDQLFVVADLSKVWAVAQVPEQQVHLVSWARMSPSKSPRWRMKSAAASWSSSAIRSIPRRAPC
jgi:hypothetical protein